MAKIAVVTDSTADIPSSLAAELGITVIPCRVHVGKQAFLDGVDLTAQRFAQLLRETSDVPRTASPPLGAFVEAYERLAREADHIISIHLAQTFTTLSDVARAAAQSVSGADIRVFESGQISMCTGWVAVSAARAARAGQPVDEIARLVESMIPRLRLLGLVPDLAYLRRSGRVSWISSVVGGVLQIKPIIMVEHGEAKLIAKVRTQSQGIARLAELVRNYGHPEKIMVIHIDAAQDAQALAAAIGELYPGTEIPVYEAGPTLGTHIGPGAFGPALVLAKP